MDPFEHDACGVGFLAELDGSPRARVLPLALTALGRMGHRGAVDADGRTGDGAGVTTQIPYAVLEADLSALGFGQAAPRDLAAGLVFLPREEEGAERARRLTAAALAAAGLGRGGWRAVPHREDVLGRKAQRSRPSIVQLVVARPAGDTDDEFESRLYAARGDATARALESGLDAFAIASLSHRTLVYKALVRAVDLADFYPDLRHPAYSTAFALFHQRFSTNTDPSWALTQPFRLLAHNGEINTIQGNRIWMEAREPSPLMRAARSDSASLDEALASLVHGGRDLLHALSLLVPPAWETDGELPAPVRDLFDYQSCVMEPWDGPAMVVFTDGRVVGAALDRNGLRPARSVVTTDGLALVASEAGVLDVPEETVLARGRLGPGDVVAVDLRARRLLDTGAIHRRLAARRPYGAWLGAHRVRGVPAPSVPALPAEAADLRVLRAFGYTREEAQLILGPMFRDGLEPLGSMGDDAPLAVLSAEPRLLFSYFKQRFAQVTNPAIDPLRETLVMSLATHLGPRGELHRETPRHAAQVHLADPVLAEADVRALEGWAGPGWRAHRLGLLFAAAGSAGEMRVALRRLLEEAEIAVRDGATLLVLSDRGVDADWAALPSLLALSALHHHLVRRGLRLRTSLVVETGEARDDHQVAALLGFGAEAVSPYLALALVRDAVRAAGGGAEDEEEALRRYRQALVKGIRKILSKMGISTLRSYHGAQLFEAVGVADELVAAHFTGTPSLMGGVGLDEIARETLARHARAYEGAADRLEEGSLHRYRRQGEVHAFEPGVVKALHAAIRTGEPLDYRRYAAIVHGRAPVAVRDLLEFRAAPSIPIEEVEPAEAILPRFMTSAMSLGALSPEAQQTLAVAMNRVGARSNSGEGGEAPEMFSTVLPGGDRPHNRIKQVASARFGVTAEYLMAADELQIKMAQGSKPGEGGQLPGHKVAAHIARVRHAPEGATLISPPPHHDIYSIEDLAQLVYDLKRVNPAATVGVKLASEAGIGTIAAGVAKAHADAVVVAGHDGGTGASPWSSIKNAGTPWELGLAETQQVLVRQGLRGRVRLQVEGGLKTGRDVVMAALLGADEYGFGSAALVAAGCVMARQCHLNTCPAGIATQREDLRRKFRGTPEDVIRFFLAIAQEVREILALLGQRRLEDVVGRTDLLEARPAAPGTKAATVTLGSLLAGTPASPRRRRHAGPRNDPPVTGRSLDEAVLARLRFGPSGPVRLALDLPVTNADRTVGARIAGEIAGRCRGRRLRPSTVRVSYRGSAGQSFGAFCVEGMDLVLEGEANDAVGKGMSGGEITVRPFRAGAAGEVIAGNAVLYGATGGRLFMAGRAGERFCVRNSGALAVVEGAGDHACEYMTAGAVVILGSTGRNLAAGMSGGLVYVMDVEGTLDRRLNAETAMAAAGVAPAEEAWLREVIRRHAERTGSVRAREVLRDWRMVRTAFRRVTSRLMAATLPLPEVRPRRAPSAARRPVLAREAVPAAYLPDAAGA